MYYDLEFRKSANPDVDGEVLVDLLLQSVKECLQDMFDITLDFNEHVLEMDSTTESKFSRHLVIRLPNSVWRSNHDVGLFNKRLLRHIH